jgi:16S rRNA (uracil1498-N3)-methyltransferase
MHRFFVSPSMIQGDVVTLVGRQSHQIVNVLRMRPGDHIVVLDNSGWEIEIQLTAVEGRAVQGEVLRRRLAGGEPRIKISLYQGVLKSRHFEFVLQKCTELGVVEYVPIITERCVISDLDDVEKKHERWESIIQEAAEQCRRGRRPTLKPAMLLSQACERSRHQGGLSLIPWEEEKTLGLRDRLRTPPQGRSGGWPPMTVNLFVGPEGGFTRQEIEMAQGYSLMPVTLGPRILRAETAGLVAAAAILYETGDLG